MADITVTAAQVGIVFPEQSEIYSAVAAAAITAGQAVYIDANGKANLADADASTPANRFRGIALSKAGAGQAVSVLVKGAVYGYDLSGMAYDDPAYLSNTAGAFGTTAGSTSIICGRVMPLTDKGLSKVLYVTGIAG